MVKSLYDIYAEGLVKNIDIFSNLIIPADTKIYTNLVKKNILQNAGELAPLYDTPELMKESIENWSRENEFIFRHLDKILKAEYSPIENTDKYLERSENREGGELITRDLKSTNIGTDSTTGTDTNTRTLNTTERKTKGTTNTETNSGTDSNHNTGSETHLISGFNSASYQPESKTDSSSTESITHGHKKTISETGTDSEINTGTITDQSNKGTTLSSNQAGTDSGTIENKKDDELKIKEHIHGNIGVTTNTELINQEVSLIRQFNAYDIISEVFIADMCIGVFNYDI